MVIKIRETRNEKRNLGGGGRRHLAEFGSRTLERRRGDKMRASAASGGTRAVPNLEDGDPSTAAPRRRCRGTRLVAAWRRGARGVVASRAPPSERGARLSSGPHPHPPPRHLRLVLASRWAGDSPPPSLAFVSCSRLVARRFHIRAFASHPPSPGPLLDRQFSSQFASEGNRAPHPVPSGPVPSRPLPVIRCARRDGVTRIRECRPSGRVVAFLLPPRLLAVPQCQCQCQCQCLRQCQCHRSLSSPSPLLCRRQTLAAVARRPSPTVFASRCDPHEARKAVHCSQRRSPSSSQPYHPSLFAAPPPTCAYIADRR